MKKRILFVDDEPFFLDGLRRMLRGQESIWDMQFAASVDEALNKLSKDSFDAVIADVKMPGKDGFELLKNMQSSPMMKDVPVIMLTGGDEIDLKRRALDTGAADLLSKPAILEDLLARIKSALSLKSYQDQLKDLNASLEGKVRERTAQLENSRLDIIWRLAMAGEYRDEATGNHVARVGWYCRVLSTKHGMPSDFVEKLFFTSPLHDTGKIGIPDSILLKNARLTLKEHEIMERHCVIGAQILLEAPMGMKAFQESEGNHRYTVAPSDNPLLKIAATIAMSHHERWDGKGYPRGLSRNDIPLEAQFTNVADTFDALCSRRPYKPAYPEDKAISIIKEESEAQFGPGVLATFGKSIEELRAIRAQFQEKSLCTHKGKS